jgi:hypothetical protein
MLQHRSGIVGQHMASCFGAPAGPRQGRQYNSPVSVDCTNKMTANILKALNLTHFKPGLVSCCASSSEAAKSVLPVRCIIVAFKMYVQDKAVPGSGIEGVDPKPHTMDKR